MSSSLRLSHDFCRLVGRCSLTTIRNGDGPEVRPRRTDRTERESASASSLPERDHFTLWHWCILSFWRPRTRTAMVSFLLKGCAFLYLLIHKIRLYLGKRWPLSASIKSSRWRATAG